MDKQARLLLIAIGVLLATSLAYWRWGGSSQPTEPKTKAARGAAEGQRGADPAREEVGMAPAESVVGAAGTSSRSVLHSSGWGRGPGQLGMPHEEEQHGETPLRIAVGKGDVFLLDDENGRIVRLGGDGGVGRDIPLPIKEPLDLAVADDGTVLVLGAGDDGGEVILMGEDGRRRGTINLDPEIAKNVRSVHVSGNNVLVESYQGELTNVGDLSGGGSDAGTVPGHPMRDGSGYMTAVIPNPEEGAVHVYVIDRATEAQRFSRLLRARVLVEGIFLVDSNLDGTIYLGVTGSPFGDPNSNEAMAELICLDALTGEIKGSVDLGVKLGPEEILDAKALDHGGVVYSVFTNEGHRVERDDCQ